MDKTLKRQIAYKPEKKSVVKTNGTTVVTPGKVKPANVVIEQPATKMGRKPKPPQDIVKIAHVWLTDKERDLIEKKFGSLTNALRETALIECYKK